MSSYGFSGILTVPVGQSIQLSGFQNQYSAKILIDRSNYNTTGWGNTGNYDAWRFIETTNTAGAEFFKGFHIGAGGVGIGFDPPLYARGGADGLYVNGNVGIGTTPPASALHVHSTTSGTTITLSDVSGGNIDTSTFQNASGALYIKTQTNSLNPAGGVYLASGQTAWSPVSDSRLKNIISPISGALANVSILNPIIYSLIADPENIPHPGFIAQDVLKVQPEAVSIDKDGFYGVRYSELIPLAVAAIKELSAENTALKTQMTSLEQSLATAIANFSSLEARLAALESK
jgi:hypothetical protein